MKSSFKESEKMSTEAIATETLLQELKTRLEAKNLSFSITLDNALNFPIVVDELEQEVYEDAIEDNPDYPFKPGQIRFEVSDGFPGQRTTSYPYATLDEAIEEAIKLQEQFGDSK